MTRNFSMTGAVHKLVKPPIQVFGIEGRYATALYSAASKEKKLDVVERELLKFQGTMKTDTKLREFLENPTIKRRTKSDGLKSVSTKVGLCAPSANFLQLLADNGRLKRINQVINSFKVIMAAHRGEVIARSISSSFMMFVFLVVRRLRAKLRRPRSWTPGNARSSKGC